MEVVLSDYLPPDQAEQVRARENAIRRFAADIPARYHDFPELKKLDQLAERVSVRSLRIPEGGIGFDDASLVNFSALGHLVLVLRWPNDDDLVAGSRIDCLITGHLAADGNSIEDIQIELADKKALSNSVSI